MGVPYLQVTLPVASTIGDRCGVRFDPASSQPGVYIYPQAGESIQNGSPGDPILLYPAGHCLLFVVGEVGVWWIEAEYKPLLG